MALSFNNVLNREFDAARPDQKWGANTPSCGRRRAGFTTPKVLDLFSRKVVGWCLSDAPDTRLILAALN